ncbi:hypothetical protein [Defluviitalea phaphyphila]|uniref:hypothetical protein n=1 Tax=Defluviitalea phaphyphila TaxID=1473580 RepID=UPI000731C484|nr:hypothetical protein [Defluviitalea phaphyphila]
MSAFLGPIHYWLYNKIILFEELEDTLVNIYSEKYGDSIKDIFRQHCDKYDYPLPKNEPLENLIDQSNIHGWLQNKISIAETRQASFLNEIFNTYKEEAINIALEAHKNQGSEVGKKSRKIEKASSAPELFKALNNYILDGMPCDRVNSIIISENDILEWETVSCLHIDYWNSVGADPNIFYNLRKTWIEAFIKNANPEYKYEFKNTSNSLFNKIIKGEN